MTLEHICGVGLLLALAACATAPAADDLAAYPASLVGTYDNAAQLRDAPDDLKRPPVADDTYDWIDLQTLTVRSVDAPAIGPHVVYAEWRDAEGAVSRQRLWSFRQDSQAARLDFYSLKDRAADAAGFAALKSEDVVGYGASCSLTITSRGRGAWNAQTDTDACHTKSQDGRELIIDARVTVMPTGVLYQETGKLADGGYAFRIPGGAPYDFRRK